PTTTRLARRRCSHDTRQTSNRQPHGPPAVSTTALGQPHGCDPPTRATPVDANTNHPTTTAKGQHRRDLRHTPPNTTKQQTHNKQTHNNHKHHPHGGVLLNYAQVTRWSHCPR